MTTTITAPNTKRATLEWAGAMALSGTIGVAVVESGAAAPAVAFARCLVGGLLLALWCAWKGWLSLSARDLHLAALGGVLLVANWVLLFASYSHSSVSVATVVYHTQPFLLLGLAGVVLGEKVRGRDLGHGAIAFAGVVLISLGGQGMNGKPVDVVGIALALGAAALYAGASLVAKQLSHVKPHLVAAVQCAVGALVLAPALLFTPLPAFGPGWWWLLVLGVVHTALMYVLMYRSIGVLQTATVALLSFLYPAVALVVDVVVYAHHVTLVEALGMLAVLVGALAHKLPSRT
ncbi:DMT family transporter [Allokutzneria sp. NRRL B-24872]|uniref:DMT family transporter n=1 Tax=Allokutzneria sp. NRRL B-24872 TaxID=1137961 RepID=UPI001FEF4823|nr:DMT family transporter [Allokutzneria sp. NRRL B-24872]